MVDLKFSKSRIVTEVCDLQTEVVSKLLQAKIISKTVSSNFLSSFFTINTKDKVRPIFNYAHLTSSIAAPKFTLPSIYQLLVRKNWDRNLFFIKLDFSQAFFNINIHSKFSYITTFKYRDTYYRFNFMPFGLSVAPFVMQTLLNQIMKFIRRYTPYAWGHIDDIIVGARNKVILKTLLDVLLPKLERIKWKVNQSSQISSVSRKLRNLK